MVSRGANLVGVCETSDVSSVSLQRSLGKPMHVVCSTHVWLKLTKFTVNFVASLAKNLFIHLKSATCNTIKSRVSTFHSQRFECRAMLVA